MKNVIILFFVLPLLIINVRAQDTVKYVGLIDNRLIYESLELYTNKTFMWMSEFDLSYARYGNYHYINDTLILSFYIDFNKPKTMSIPDSIKTIPFPIMVSKLIVDKDKMYRTNNNGRKIKRIREPGLKTRWNWIFGHKYEYYLRGKTKIPLTETIN
jgi:hypothetical protein